MTFPGLVCPVCERKSVDEILACPEREVPRAHGTASYPNRVDRFGVGQGSAACPYVVERFGSGSRRGRALPILLGLVTMLLSLAGLLVTAYCVVSLLTLGDDVIWVFLLLALCWTVVFAAATLYLMYVPGENLVVLSAAPNCEMVRQTRWLDFTVSTVRVGTPEAVQLELEVFQNVRLPLSLLALLGTPAGLGSPKTLAPSLVVAALVGLASVGRIEFRRVCIARSRLRGAFHVASEPSYLVVPTGIVPVDMPLGDGFLERQLLTAICSWRWQPARSEWPLVHPEALARAIVRGDELPGIEDRLLLLGTVVLPFAEAYREKWLRDPPKWVTDEVAYDAISRGLLDSQFRPQPASLGHYDADSMTFRAGFLWLSQREPGLMSFLHAATARGLNRSIRRRPLGYFEPTPGA